MTEEVVNADVNTNVEPTTGQESSTDETNFLGIEVIGGEPKSEPKAETETGTEATKTESDVADEQSTAPGENPRKNADTRKQQLNNEIRDKVAERNQLKAEIAELTRQKLQLRSEADLPTVDSLLGQQNPNTGDYYTRVEAELARIKAERELESEQRKLDEYAGQVADNRLRLDSEATKALADFPMFDEESADYDKELAAKADAIANNLLIRDNSGAIIGSRGSIYNVYAALAEAASSAKVKGEINGRKATQAMMNSVDVLGSASSNAGTADDDPFLRGLGRNN